MPRIRTAKALAKRIDLQYFKHPNLIKRWRMYLTIAFAALAVVWIAHAVLTTSCDVCHVVDANSKFKFKAEVKDSACLACHDAPAHNKLATFTPTCASCHVEH